MFSFQLLALLLILFICNPATFSSMTYFARKSVPQQYKDANAVFSGKVIAEKYRPVTQPEGIFPSRNEVLTVKFRVDLWWKGGKSEEVVLYTSVVRSPNGLISSMAWDYVFRVGEDYLVYAYESKDELRTKGREDI